MNSEEEIAVSYINSVRRANCQLLMQLLNDYWTNATFGHKGLDKEKVAELTKTIRNHAFNMLKVCEKQMYNSDWQQQNPKRRSRDIHHHAEESAKKKQKKRRNCLH